MITLHVARLIPSGQTARVWYVFDKNGNKVKGEPGEPRRVVLDRFGATFGVAVRPDTVKLAMYKSVFDANKHGHAELTAAIVAVIMENVDE